VGKKIDIKNPEELARLKERKKLPRKIYLAQNAEKARAGCLVPQCDGVAYDAVLTKTELWDKYYMAAPARQRCFANRNQLHFCGRHDLAAHFCRKPPENLAIFKAVLQVIRRGPPGSPLPG
jgi:hypothetical protein